MTHRDFFRRNPGSGSGAGFVLIFQEDRIGIRVLPPPFPPLQRNRVYAILVLTAFLDDPRRRKWKNSGPGALWRAHGKSRIWPTRWSCGAIPPSRRSLILVANSPKPKSVRNSVPRSSARDPVVFSIGRCSTKIGRAHV